VAVSQRDVERARVVLARRDPNAFVEECWKDKYGNRFVQGDIHRDFQDAASAHRHVMFETHRFAGKTSQAMARAVWEHGRDRDLGTTIICANEEKAKKRLNEIRLNVERNADVRRVFPDLEVQSGNTSQLLFTDRGISRDMSVEAYGVLSSGTGDRSDLLIFDDVCDRRNTLSQPALRRQVKEAYGDWMNLLGPDGRSWYLYTQWHNEDLSQDLKNRGTIPLIRRLVNIDWTSAWEPRRVDPVWPEKWDAKALLQRMHEIGPRAFKRDFCGQAVDDSERAIWPEWFQFGPPPFPLGSAVRVQLWDGAAPRRTGGRDADYMAYVDMYVSALAGKVFFADAWRARGLKPSEQVAAVRSRLLFGPTPRYLVIEQQGESALAALVAESGIVGDSTTLVPITSEGKRKEIRAAEYLAPLMEGGHVVWAEKLDPEWREDAPPVKAELVDLPFGDHDDLADCAVYGARVAKRVARFGMVEGNVPEVTAEVNIY
jgi:hypothetical protein